MREELVIDALNMAIFRRKALAVPHHSDGGSECTSIAFAVHVDRVRPML
jgi:hypothetical protein